MNETMQILTPIFTGIAVGLTFLVLMQVVMNWRGVQTYFNMVPRREVMTDTTWGRLTFLMKEAGSGISAWKSYDGVMTYSLSVTYKDGDADISNRFSEPDVNLVVNKAWDWSVQRGYIKEAK
jgi:hypothetical protein